MAETILTGRRACYRCTVACGRLTSIQGRHATEGIDGPEYETVAAFGSLLLSDDLPGAAYAGHLCNVYGLDIISTGCTIAFAYYLHEQGTISKDDTSGLELRWGDIEPALALIEQIAHREGFGAILAEGARHLGQQYGVEDLAVQVNGLEVPMHDPRAFAGMGLAYATSPRGACHNKGGDMFRVDLGGAIYELGIDVGNRFESSTDKALVTSRIQDWRTLQDSMVMCMFNNADVHLILDMLNAATGWDLQMSDLLPLGERAFNLKRLLNGKLGLTSANDRLPKLLLQPLMDEEVETHVPDMEVLLPAYYRVRGWDRQTGMPTTEKLRELGLEGLLS
jgi:aldehyde:ferredoxin oxidoreductase